MKRVLKRNAGDILFACSRNAVFLCAAASWMFALERFTSRFPDDIGGEPLSLNALFALWGLAATGQMAFAALAGILLAAAEVFRRFIKDTRAVSLIVGALAGALAAAPFHLASRAIFGGSWISEQGFAPFAGSGFTLLGAGLWGLIGCTAFRFRALEDENLKRKRAISAGLLFASVFLSAIDVAIFPDLYPEFHLLLYAASSALICLTALRLAESVKWQRRRRVGIVFGLLCLAALLTGSTVWFRMERPARAELNLKSPLAARVIGRTTIQAFDEFLKNVTPKNSPKQGGPSFQSTLPRHQIKAKDDWNVLLLVVDALRADAVPPVRKPGQKHSRESDTPFLDEWIAKSYRFHTAYAGSSTTLTSMPSMFRSAWAHECFSKSRISLAEHLTALGRAPVAVVNDFFTDKSREKARLPLEGFKKVEVYKKTAAHEAVSKALSLVDKVRSKPFFAWINFYFLHDPGFADGRLLSASDGSWIERYRRSLIWLDGQIGELFAGLEKMGILSKTIVVLASDHGESLGAHGARTHGKHVFEEEVRVPLMFRIPGYQGGDVKATVGNADIAPTILDLLGAPLDGRQRGASLAPLMLDPDREWRREYYLQNNNNRIIGVVKDRLKLIYHTDAQVYYHYDLARDPKEKTDLFGRDERADRALLESLVFLRPRLAGFDRDTE